MLAAEQAGNQQGVYAIGFSPHAHCLGIAPCILGIERLDDPSPRVGQFSQPLVIAARCLSSYDCLSADR